MAAPAGPPCVVDQEFPVGGLPPAYDREYLRMEPCSGRSIECSN